MPSYSRFSRISRCAIPRAAVACLALAAITAEADARPRDRTAPTVQWTSPAEGTSVSGLLADASAPTLCQVSASDNRGVASVVFTRDGGVAVNTETSAPYNCNLDTTTIPDGTHTLRATAYDGAGNAASTTRTITVSNGSPPPAPTPPPPPPPPPPTVTPTPQTSWRAAGSTPLSDGQAAALVTHRSEIRPENSAANNYVPSDAQLSAYYAATNDYGQPNTQSSPLAQYVTGRSGLTSPSTDDLIQWTAHKWGIPEDIIRAEMATESWWRQSGLGDRAWVSSTWFSQYPSQSRISGTSDVYQSMGIMQIKWRPDGTVGAGTEPLRWQSTAFNLDHYAATVRYYYDGYCSWCTSGYGAGQDWNSIGAWYTPYPWANSGAQSYIQAVKDNLARRVWTQSGF